MLATLEWHARRGSWQSSQPDWRERLESPRRQTLVNVSMNSLEGRDYVFSAVARAPPSAAGAMRQGDVEWRTLSNLHGVSAFAYASLAMRRELQLRQASGGAPLVIGALGTRNRWCRTPWAQRGAQRLMTQPRPPNGFCFSSEMRKTAARLAAAMTRLDAGDGRLANWALNVKSDSRRRA